MHQSESIRSTNSYPPRSVHGGWALFRGWLLANILGWSGGMVPGYFFPVREPVMPLITGVCLGFIMGLAQWRVLRRRVPHAGWWIPVTTGALLLLWAINPTRLGLITGCIIGVAQWSLLRHKLDPIGFWIIANLLAWLLSSYFTAWILLDGPVGTALNAGVSPLVNHLVFWGMFGLLYGSITGAALWLMHYRLAGMPASQDGAP